MKKQKYPECSKGKLISWQQADNNRRPLPGLNTTMITLNINGKDIDVDAKPDELLVWVINEKVGLTSTRFGCGIEMCGACKVLINGETARSCVIDVGEVVGKKITTKEGVPDDHPLKIGENAG